MQEKKLISISFVALCASSAGTLAFPVALGKVLSTFLLFFAFFFLTILKIIDMVTIGDATAMNQYIYLLVCTFISLKDALDYLFFSRTITLTFCIRKNK